MLPPSYLDQMPDAFVQLWQQVEEQILQDVARRIGKMDAVTPTANWQLWRYQQTEAVRPPAQNDRLQLTAVLVKDHIVDAAQVLPGFQLDDVLG